MQVPKAPTEPKGGNVQATAWKVSTSMTCTTRPPRAVSLYLIFMVAQAL